jgi:hypothetical protein
MGGRLSTNFARALRSASKVRHHRELREFPALRDQEHRIGPAIFTEIALSKDLKITPDVGLLFGLTSSTPDVALKLNIGYRCTSADSRMQIAKPLTAFLLMRISVDLAKER